MYAVRNKLNYDPARANRKVKYPNLQGYPISKLANYYHAKTLSDELKGTGVTANAVHPGFVRTEFMTRNVEDKVKAFLNKILSWVAVLARTEKDGSHTIVHAAVDPELDEVTGEFFRNMTQTTDQLTKIAKIGEEAEKLSKFSYDQCQDYLSKRPLTAQDTTNKKINDIDDDEKEAGQAEEKEEILLQSTEAAFVTNAVEDVALMSLSTSTDNLHDKKKDEQEEMKEEILLQPTKVAFVPNDVEEIATIGESTNAEYLRNESLSASLNDRSRDTSPMKTDFSASPLITAVEDISTSITDDES